MSANPRKVGAVSSLLMAAVWKRLAGALALVGLLWLAVAWALG